MSTPWMALICNGVLLASAGIGLAADPVAGPDTSNLSVADQLADPWSSPEIAAPRMDHDLLKRPRVAGPDTNSGEAGGRRADWLRTSASLAGVVALIMLLAWGYRLVASGRLSLTPRSKNSAVIEVLSRTNLAPRQSLSLVRIGSQLILIGATSDSIRTLSVIDDGELAARLAGQQTRLRADSHTAEFQRCLQTEARTYDESDRGSDQSVPGVIDLRHKLSQTMERLRSAIKQA
ncbi:MAG: flagellar biosynthetic protein FliO [Planctomycetota bacterium]